MAFLLAPCIVFLWAAGYAVIYGTDYAVLLGIVLQVYLILRLRAHYKKLAAGATVSS